MSNSDPNVSEAWFDEYLTSHGYDFQREPDLGVRVRTWAYVLHALLTRLPRVPPALDPRAREASERRDVISSN